MARLTIDLGTAGNSATGDSVRGAFNKCNTNFAEIYTDLANAGLGGLFTTPYTNGDVKIQPNGTGSIEIDQLKIDSSTITSIGTNSDITITPNGTGNIVLDAITIDGNNIAPNRSNDDLKLSASGTGSIKLESPTEVTGLMTTTKFRAPRYANDSAASTGYGAVSGGELYYDTGNNLLKVWNGSSWVALHS